MEIKIESLSIQYQNKKKNILLIYIEGQMLVLENSVNFMEKEVILVSTMY